jgi:hypothetical protein
MQRLAGYVHQACIGHLEQQQQAQVPFLVVQGTRYARQLVDIEAQSRHDDDRARSKSVAEDRTEQPGQPGLQLGKARELCS